MTSPSSFLFGKYRERKRGGSNQDPKGLGSFLLKVCKVTDKIQQSVREILGKSPNLRVTD